MEETLKELREAFGEYDAFFLNTGTKKIYTTEELVKGGHIQVVCDDPKDVLKARKIAHLCETLGIPFRYWED